MVMRTFHTIIESVRNPIWTSTRYKQAPRAATTEDRVSSECSSHEMLIFNSMVKKKSSSKRRTSNRDVNGLAFFQHYKQRLSGWRVAALNFAICALIVFILNLILTVYASLHERKGDGLFPEGILSEGDCGRIKRINSALHILLNVLSTVLLSGSNYCMQCLSAPTRGEIDKAHAAQRWLDIGVLSFRNLWQIKRRRVTLWLLLGMSSFPLHLLYNSAVYASISTNTYDVFLVSQAFVDDTECRNCTNADPDGFHDAATTLKSLWSKSQSGSLIRLTPGECVAAYGTAIQTKWRNLLIVTADNEKYSNFTNILLLEDWMAVNNTNVYMGWREDALMNIELRDEVLGWICSGLTPHQDSQCVDRLGEINSAPQPWVICPSCIADTCKTCELQRMPSAPHWSVDYCLSEPAEPRCQLQFNLVIAVVVTVLNFFKAALMIYIVYSTEESPLMTIGDAIASFLDEQDDTTKGMGLLSISDLRKGHSVGTSDWEDRRWRWKDATSKKRRTITVILISTTLISATALLIWGVKTMYSLGSTSISAAFSFGFGAVEPRATIQMLGVSDNMIAIALVSNSAQVILSLLYYMYNGLFTAMLTGHEWTSYAYDRKGLRVSRRPFDNQRSTYFLQLPYRFGVPLLVLSATLHWLVSQSIFVVAIDFYDRRELSIGLVSSMRTCGYSPIAILSTVILAAIMLAALVASGFIPYKRGMPLVGNCSLAISAACHPHQNPEDEAILLSEQKVQWGVVSTNEDGIGHCAFSSEEVTNLVKGRAYF